MKPATDEEVAVLKQHLEEHDRRSLQPVMLTQNTAKALIARIESDTERITDLERLNFQKHLSLSKITVSRWPKWQQEALGGTAIENYDDVVSERDTLREQLERARKVVTLVEEDRFCCDSPAHHGPVVTHGRFFAIEHSLEQSSVCPICEALAYREGE